MNDYPPEDGLLEREAERVLERATEIEARQRRDVSIDELRHAVLAAGIPLDAFERALSEVRGAAVEAQTADSVVTLGLGTGSTSLTTTLRRTGLVTLGAGLSWLAFALSGVFGVDVGVTLQFSLVLAFFAACGLVVARRLDRDVVNFEFDLASLWVGLTLVWMLFDPIDAAAILTQMGLIGGIAGIVGAVLVNRSPHPLLGSVTDDEWVSDPAGDSL